MTDEQWEELTLLLGADWLTRYDGVVSAVRALGLIKDKAAELTTFKERLGNDWQRALNSLASSARKLPNIEWKALLDELQALASKPFKIALVADRAVGKANKKLKTPRATSPAGARAEPRDRRARRAGPSRGARA
jgi:hypothetical protein